MNCKKIGHTSWDQSCPKFTEESKRLKHLNPESMYIYFPTDELWTWEQLRNLTTSEMGTMTPTQETHDTQNQQHRQETRTNIELTEEHPSEDKAVTCRQTPKHSPTHLSPPYQVKNHNRVHQHENSDSDWQYHLGRQRIMDEFAPSLSNRGRQCNPNPPRA